MINGLTYQEQYEMAQNLCQDESTAATTFLKQQLNVGGRIFTSELGSFFNEKTTTFTTTASQFTQTLPADCLRPKSVYITVNNYQYPMTEVFDESLWRKIQSGANTITSDYPTHMYSRRDTIEFFPKITSAGNTGTIIYEPLVKDLSEDDYTAGTITTATNGSTAVVGSSTSWTSAMAGRFFKTDDGQWYEISSITDTTHLVLVRNYAGTSISTGTSGYTIGEMMRIPGPTHHGPVYFACFMYYTGYKKDKTYGSLYKGLYESELERAKGTYNDKFTTDYIPSQYKTHQGLTFTNPNDFPTIT